MEQVLHGNARTTPAIRRAIQNSQKSLQSLAKLYNINPKTVAKWRNRCTTTDDTMGPVPGSTTLTVEERALVMAFRRYTLLPLTDCLSALQATIPHLSRSTLHRCFQCHGISRLPPPEEKQLMPKKKFTDYPLGLLRIDSAVIWPSHSGYRLYVAIDRISKVIFAELHPNNPWLSAADFLERVLKKLPYQVHSVLTDRKMRFPSRAFALVVPGESEFNDICRTYGAKRWQIKSLHCWSQNQVETMAPTLREAIALRLFDETIEEINKQLQAFLLAYNHTTRLKSLRGLTPHEFVCTQWQSDSTAFSCDPTHLVLGLNT